MPLFDVPGWSVPSTAPSQSSQKRKRPGNDVDKVQSAEVNLDKLMNRLRDKGDDDNPRASKKRKRSASDAGEKAEGPESRKGKGISDWGLRRKEKKPTTSMISRPKKMKGKKDVAKPADQTTIPSLTRTKSPATSTGLTCTKTAVSPPAATGLTPLQKTMKQSLDGARFR